MLIESSVNRRLPDRYHRCEWWYEADDSEFPSRFEFELVYQICDDDIVIQAIEPQSVVTSDLKGNRLFWHQFNDSERSELRRWFGDRLGTQREFLMEAMCAEIEFDRQSRSDRTAATFQEARRMRAMSNEQ